MLKIGKSEVLGALKASLPPHKRPKNENGAHFCNIPLSNIHDDARKLYIVSIITLGTHMERPENAKNGKIRCFRRLICNFAPS